MLIVFMFGVLTVLSGVAKLGAVDPESEAPQFRAIAWRARYFGRLFPVFCLLFCAITAVTILSHV